MKFAPISAVLFLVCLFLASAVWAQAPAVVSQSGALNNASASSVEVPRLIKFSGTLLEEGQALKGPVGVTFALYAQQTGGAALWVETQNVKPDVDGAYAVLLGAASANGVPAELFVSGEARWLGIQVAQQPEHERILLVSVPYALKAGDSETLGGLPASAFVLAQPAATASGNAGTNPSGRTAPGTNSRTVAKATTPTAAGAPAANFLPVFTNSSGALGSSVIFQDPTTNNIGVRTNAPLAPLHVVGNTLLVTSLTTTQVQFRGAASEARFGQDASGAFFASDTPGKAVRFYTNNGKLNEGLRIDSSSNVGIGTMVPAAKLDVASAVTTGNLFRVASPTGGFAVQATGCNAIRGFCSGPNIIAGFSGNTVGSAIGATVSGGGQTNSINSATGDSSTVSGGASNTASGTNATAGGGFSNTASGTFATVSGGYGNTASGQYATVSGGQSNTAQGNGSFAAGQGAQAMQNGTFVWADNTLASGVPLNFTSTAVNQFLIRASGGVGIGTASPSHQLEVVDSSNTGLRVQTNTSAGTVASFGPNGDFQIDAPFLLGGRLVVKESGMVGIGNVIPAATLDVGPTKTTLADAWTVRSSAHLKTNIQPIIGALDKIQKLRGVSYDWKANGKHDIGLIAEEVAQVVPEIVAYEPNTNNAQGLDYARLTALLIEAVKQQQTQINLQKAQIRRLQSRLQQLLDRL